MLVYYRYLTRVSRQLGKENFMQKMQFSIEIEAPKEKVWQTLWEDKTLRDWGNIIDEGLYMVGEMAEGSEVQFIPTKGSNTPPFAA